MRHARSNFYLINKVKTRFISPHSQSGLGRRKYGGDCIEPGTAGAEGSLSVVTSKYKKLSTEY